MTRELEKGFDIEYLSCVLGVAFFNLSSVFINWISVNLRIAHLRIGHMVGNPEVGNPEVGNPES